MKVQLCAIYTFYLACLFVKFTTLSGEEVIYSQGPIIETMKKPVKLDHIIKATTTQNALKGPANPSQSPVHCYCLYTSHCNLEVCDRYSLSSFTLFSKTLANSLLKIPLKLTSNFLCIHALYIEDWTLCAWYFLSFLTAPDTAETSYGPLLQNNHTINFFNATSLRNCLQFYVPSFWIVFQTLHRWMLIASKMGTY